MIILANGVIYQIFHFFFQLFGKIGDKVFFKFKTPVPIPEPKAFFEKATVREIVKNVGRVCDLIQFLAISRSLERIADHATNIAEDVSYMIDGAIVRHREYDGN